jgi:hypothetical protein
MPANLITLPHFSVSSAMSLPNVADGPRQRHVSEVSETGVQLGVDKPGVDRLVQHIDNLSRDVAGRGDPIERGGLIGRKTWAGRSRW